MGIMSIYKGLQHIGNAANNAAKDIPNVLFLAVGANGQMF
jgi:hypothetical protein